MPQPRDKKLSKRALKRLESSGVEPGEQAVSNLRPLSMSAPMHLWPVHECLVPQNWNAPGEMVQLVVTRRSEAGEYASAIILVDLGCLGIKNAYAMRFTDANEYHAWLNTLPFMAATERISLDLAAKIVRTALDYAVSLGFRPHRDYALASPFLRDANPDRADEDVPTGFEGKPYFINGPYDNVRKITQQLNQRVGAGNYNVTLFSGPPDDLSIDEIVYIDNPEALP